MKEEKLLLEGIFAMIEEMREKICHTEVSSTMPTVDLSGIEILIKHWKTKSIEQTVNMEKSLAAKLDGLAAFANKTTNSYEKLTRIIEMLQQPPVKPQAQRLYHVIDLKSSKTVRYILIQWLLIFLLLGCGIWLTNTNMGLRDNDLKYRYIKSVNTNNEFIHHLENVFKYNKDRDEIKTIREKVKKYEDEVNRRAEKIETGQQNE